jgi:glucosamine-6-phosphate deaminase
MQVEVLDDEQRLAGHAADIIGDAVRSNARLVLALPTGETPLLTYAELARRRGVSFEHATAFAVDEFAGAPARDAPGTNFAFFREHLAGVIGALHVPDAAAPDPDREIHTYADLIRKRGGIDLCLLGVGTNGHIAFNEPPSAVDAPARVVALTDVTRAAHAAAFGGLTHVPRAGMTLGIADLLAASRVVVLAAGKHKAAVVRAAVEGPQTAAVPASWLQRHSSATWLLDTAAAAALTGAHA